MSLSEYLRDAGILTPYDLKQIRKNEARLGRA